ncbi:D-aminoacyl-tRNA deacylase [Thiomicrorhabdus hydrogeniphila]
MICLIQRVTQASVSINNQEIANIGPGLVILTGFEPNDDLQQIHKMMHKLLNYRIFADKNDKMNLNVQQVMGELLLVPQFTLAANTKSGLRPSFSSSAAPQVAEKLFHYFINYASENYEKIQTGQFGADMQVSLINDGPVTFWLQT